MICLLRHGQIKNSYAEAGAKTGLAVGSGAVACVALLLSVVPDGTIYLPTAS
jgi:hypothetical protein